MSVAQATDHAADRLLNAIDRVASPVCVGLDPVLARLPVMTAGGRLRETEAESSVESIETFSLHVLEAVAPHVPCVKFQSACYERYGVNGIAALQRLMHEADRMGLEVILDAKRGDIGLTAEHYAAAAFDPLFRQPAWITINSYLGVDGMTPFLQPGRGAFALVRTSNPGGDAIQNLELASGGVVADAVAGIVAAIGRDHIGKRGFSSLGAVVGATKPHDAEHLRDLMPQQIFLVPGYGAQGGSMKDVRACFRRDSAGRLTGAIVTASRLVIYAYKRGDTYWKTAIADAAARFADEIGSAMGMR